MATHNSNALVVDMRGLMELLFQLCVSLARPADRQLAS